VEAANTTVPAPPTNPDPPANSDHHDLDPLETHATPLPYRERLRWSRERCCFVDSTGPRLSARSSCCRCHSGSPAGGAPPPPCTRRQAPLSVRRKRPPAFESSADIRLLGRGAASTCLGHLLRAAPAASGLLKGTRAGHLRRCRRRPRYHRRCRHRRHQPCKSNQRRGRAEAAGLRDGGAPLLSAPLAPPLSAVPPPSGHPPERVAQGALGPLCVATRW
jgi:hypothetical protein